MKLPKTGKLKLPNKGERKASDKGGDFLSKVGGFHIKNRFLRKNLFSLIVAAVLAIGTGTVYGTLSSTVADRGDDPVNGVNQDRYQVLVSGEGFKLNKKQEKDYKLQKQQNKVNAANAAQNPQTIRSSTGTRTFRSSYSSHRYTSHYSSKLSKNPRVTSNITEQISMESAWKAGDTLKFRVSAFAYPYGIKNAISAEDIEISVEGGKEATLYRTKDAYNYYSVELGEGKNKITITATDKKTKKSTKLGPYIVKVEEGSGSNTDPTQDPDNPGTPETPATKTVSVAVHYGNDGLNNLNKEVGENMTVGEALQEMGVTVSGNEITFVPGSFSLDKLDGELLRNVYKDSLSEGEEFNEDSYKSWLNDSDNPVKAKMKDGAGKDHPFESTHWECGTSLDTIVKDLDSGITLTLVL